jgi:glycosyltransferase involved in cell wall biosynthesis
MHIFIHLLNDFSGSPRIMGAKIASYRRHGAQCCVITNAAGGFIAAADGPHRFVSYAKAPTNKPLWLLRLLWWHLRTFLVVLRLAGPGDTVHASTLLTAPHLLAARLKGARTVIHIMETEVSPRAHKAILIFFATRFAQRVIYLSAYVRTALGHHFAGWPWRITYPCIDPAIMAAANAPDRPRDPARPFTVGLVCSMIWHKGYAEFIELARLCPDLCFLLVLNGSEAALDAQIPRAARPANLTVRFSVKQIGTALADMDLLVSLTRREGWIETFGLTLIEAMAFGLPVIAPDIGAPTEFIEHGINGFLVNEADLARIGQLIGRLHADGATYARMAKAARATAERFSDSSFQAAVGDELGFVSA